MTPRIVPLGTVRLRSSTAVASPKRLVARSTTTAASRGVGAVGSMGLGVSCGRASRGRRSGGCRVRRVSEGGPYRPAIGRAGAACSDIAEPIALQGRCDGGWSTADMPEARSPVPWSGDGHDPHPARVGTRRRLRSPSRTPATPGCATRPTPAPASPGDAGVAASATSTRPASRSATDDPAATHPVAGHPAGLDRRVDLPRPGRPPPGHRPRRARPQAVPLSPALARAPRRGQVRADARLRRRRCHASAAAATRTWRARACRARRSWRPSSGSSS